MRSLYDLLFSRSTIIFWILEAIRDMLAIYSRTNTSLESYGDILEGKN